MAAYEPSAASWVFDALSSKKLLVVSGKGGVGRSTLAALLGLEIARRGRRVLVATTGHDDRLAWMNGLGSLSAAPQQVNPRLWIMRVEPAQCIKEYGALVLRTPRVAELVFGNQLMERLIAAIPGLEDFAILGKVWHEATRGGHFDTVVFDGPASGHLRLTLGIPRALVEVAPRGRLRDEAVAMHASLRDAEQSAAVLVGLPESWPLTELAELAGALHAEVGLELAALVVNKCWPELLPALGEGPDEAPAPLRDALAHLELLRVRGAEQARVLAEFLSAGTGALRPMLTLPMRGDGLFSPADFDALRRELEQRDRGFRRMSEVPR